MYLVSAVPSERKSHAVLSRKRKKESPLVRKRQNTALESLLLSKNAEVASASATAATKARRLRHRAVAGFIRERHTSPHYTWFNVRERLKEADISRKADLQKIARFLRQVLPTHSIAEPGEVKLGATSSPRKIVEPGEFASEENPTITLHQSGKHYTKPQNNHLHPLLAKRKTGIMTQPLVTCLKKKT
jgi:hypothetical protein